MTNCIMTVGVKTKVFDLYAERYRNLSELAHAMGISPSQFYRMRQGKRPINERFIVGTIQAFPDYNLGNLFYLDLGLAYRQCERTVNGRVNHIRDVLRGGE
ncbi:hypothetical protein ACFLUO_10080 [Chloroflexota bacterium]